MKRIALAAVAALLAAGSAHAQLNVAVTQGWVRATVPAQKATGGFATLTATHDARLVEAQSPVAGRVEIHRMEMVDNVMKMREAGAIDLPAGKAVELKPGGLHLMLMDLKRPLRAGERVPVAFYIEGKDKSRTNVTVNMAVQAPGAAPAAVQH